MDSNQPATKDPNVNILQNQDNDKVPSSSKEDGASIENFQKEINPLQIGSILEKVFSNLDLDSIKNARQVNPLWSIEGAKMLITKCYLEIPSNLQIQEYSKNSEVLDKFKAFLSHKLSDQCMIPNITIDRVGDVELWKSLGVFGQQVESLKLNIVDDEGEMLKNLLDLLPNLKYLNITNIGYLDWYQRGLGIIKSLIAVISSTEKDQSPLVISNINLRATNMVHLKNIEKFADCNNIWIEKLMFELYPFASADVPYFKTRKSNFMNKLLSRSKNIIKSLTLRDRTLALSLLEFPCMPVLSYLEFYFHTDAHDPLEPIKFSPTFRFTEKVPNLNHFKFFVYINHSGLREKLFEHLFEQTGTAPSVKILELDRYLDDFDIDPLLLTFPNIEEYTTSGVQYSREMFQSLWTYGANLRKLTIKIEKRWGISMDIYNLDSFITGFTREMVDKIKKTPNLAPHPLEEMEKLRVNPSILNLKHLEHLTIKFRCFEENDFPERFLATAGEYAFKLMPKDSKILMDITCGRRRSGGNSVLNEVSKLPNVTVNS